MAVQPAWRSPGLVCDWCEAARGAVCAAPGGVPVLFGDAGLGLFLTIGAMPVAMLGVPQARQATTRLLTIGALFAIAYALGSVVGTAVIVALLALTAAASLAALAMTRSPVARLIAGLIVPAFALGTNEPPSSELALAAVFLAGSVRALLVAIGFRRISPEAPAAARGMTTSGSGPVFVVAEALSTTPASAARP